MTNPSTSSVLSKSALAKNFERYVASIYNALEFVVSHDIHLNGYQIDVFAEKRQRGVGSVRIAIECKYTDKESLPGEEVDDFLARIQVLRMSGSITHGVCVSNRPFTRFAKERAASMPFAELVTLDELESGLAALREPLLAQKADYEASRMFSAYVAISGVCRDLFTKTTGGQKPYSINSVEQFLLDQLKSANPPATFVFSDFGGGKTTLAERLRYKITCDYLNGISDYRPIVIYLRDYAKYNCIEMLIEKSLVSQFGFEIKTELFFKFTTRGSLCVILDGLDEMFSHGTEAERAKQMMELAPFFKNCSRLIVTCRPAYFVSKAEYMTALERLDPNRWLKPFRKESKNSRFQRQKELFLRGQRILAASDGIAGTDQLSLIISGAIAIDLDVLTTQQIDHYLQNHESHFRAVTHGECGWIEVREYLDSVYDLSDLMQRPIILDMITNLIVNGVLDVTRKGEQLGPTQLYELYTHRTLHRDWMKAETRQTCLTETQRLDYSIAMALTMFNTSRLQVGHEDIVQVVEQAEIGGSNRQSLLDEAKERIASDIRVCTFIGRSNDDTFRFVHKSFMEFFVAQHMRRTFDEGALNPLWNKRLPKEVLYFFGGYGISEIDFRSRLIRFYKKKLTANQIPDAVLENATAAIVYSAYNHDKLNLDHGVISEVDLVRTSFEKSSFRRAVFRTVTANKSAFIMCDFTRSSIDKSTFRRCKMQQCRGDIEMVSSELSECAITGESKLQIKCSNSTLSRSECTDSEVELRGEIFIQDITVNKSTLVISVSKGRVENLNISECKVEIGIDSATGLVCKNSSLVLMPPTIATGWNLTSCQISLAVQRMRGISLRNSHLKDCVISNLMIDLNKLKLDDADTYKLLDFWSCEFLNCQFKGTLISGGTARQILDPLPDEEAKASIMENCSGIVLYGGKKALQYDVAGEASTIRNGVLFVWLEYWLKNPNFRNKHRAILEQVSAVHND